MLRSLVGIAVGLVVRTSAEYFEEFAQAEIANGTTIKFVTTQQKIAGKSYSRQRSAAAARAQPAAARPYCPRHGGVTTFLLQP